MSINITNYEDIFGHRLYSVSNTLSNVLLSAPIKEPKYSFLSNSTVRIGNNIDIRRNIDKLTINFKIGDWVDKSNLSLYVIASTVNQEDRTFISIPVRFNNRNYYLTASNIKNSGCFNLQLSERANGVTSSNLYVNSIIKFKDNNTLEIPYNEHFDLLIDSIVVSPYLTSDDEYPNINSLYFLDDLERTNSKLPYRTSGAIKQLYDYTNLNIDYKTSSDYKHIDDGKDQYKIVNEVVFMGEVVNILSYLKVKILLNCEDDILNNLKQVLEFRPLCYAGNSMYTTSYYSSTGKMAMTDNVVARYTNKYIEPLFIDPLKTVKVDLGVNWKESFKTMDGLNILDKMEIDFRMSV